MKHLLNWQVGYCETPDGEPKKWYAATVPGAVQLDYAKHYKLDDYRKGVNFKDYQWMEDKYWIYTAEFDFSDCSNNANHFLVVNGIDYRYEIFVCGDKVCEYEGMYRKQVISLSPYKNCTAKITIKIFPVPKSTLPGVHANTLEEANQCCKPAVSYGWDFHPRLIPTGIWDDIYVEETLNETVSEPSFCYELSADLTNADVVFNYKGIKDAELKLYDSSDNLIYCGTGENQKFTLDNVELWWCNGYGKQALYRYTVSKNGSVFFDSKIGFKKIELIKAEGSWGEGLNYPMSRNTPPITVRLNNTVIFAKGTNWVAPEIFYGTIDEERYRGQLEMVKKANFNFVRCWGGAIINKDCFFAICDELGILVWQEFPLACNCYQGTKHYISVLKNEATAIIERINKHVCLMMWCGGNELFNNWSCMTDQDIAIRLMNKLTFDKTPQIPFLPTSPIMGMAHGPYSFIMDGGTEIIKLFSESHDTAYTEFGGGGFSVKETLDIFGDKEDFWPIDRKKEIIDAHAIRWHFSEQMTHYFGEIETLEQTMECSQFLQSVGQSFIFEEARRQKPYCSIVANWCFNEPWPNIANNSLLSYPNYKKPAYYAVANSCRSVLASARYRKLLYIAGETLDFDLYLLNDSIEKIKDGTVHVYVQIGEAEKVWIMDWDYKNVLICKNAVGPTVRYVLPHKDGADTLTIFLECGEYSSKYTLLYRLPAAPPNAPKKMNAILDENNY